MTGFDETVPPDDVGEGQDASSARNATDNVVDPNDLGEEPAATSPADDGEKDQD